MNYDGILSLLPVAVVIVLVFITKRTTFSLLIGTVVGCVMLYGWNFAKPWFKVLYGVIGSDLWIWLMLVCSFFGSLVALFDASGGIYGFGNIAGKVCRGERSSLLTAWILGIVVFIDDWLSILTVGAAMRGTTDRFKIPREMLAFLSSVTASSACVIFPVSTWGVFMTSQLVSTGVCSSDAGLSTFSKTIPLLFYPLMMLLCGGLYSAGVLPSFGPMKQAYLRVRTAEARNSDVGQTPEPERKRANPLNLLLPVVFIIAVTVATGEILYGTFAGLIFCAVLYLPQRLMTPGQYLDTILSGFKDMMGVIFIVTCAFMLRDINNLLKMPDFIISAVKTGVSPAVLPLAAFLIVSFLGFVAGNFWGICAISFPIIIPFAQALGCNLLLTSAAIISATVAGSNACFYGAEATLACSSSNIENIQYAKTVLPMIAVPFGVSCLLYLIAGFVLG